jgi:hypothetical protein
MTGFFVGLFGLCQFTYSASEIKTIQDKLHM